MNFDFDSLWARALTCGAMVCCHYVPLPLEVLLDGKNFCERKDAWAPSQPLLCTMSVVIRLVMHAIAKSCVPNPAVIFGLEQARREESTGYSTSGRPQ